VILNGHAHPIDEHPLVLGLGPGPGRRLALVGPLAGISYSHCTLLRCDANVIVRDHSRYGTFLNGERVDGEAALDAGDRLRLGTPGVVLELVAVA
jgi:pSer/pThr/pTyr-binding forkhead associated (FHA) protein